MLNLRTSALFSLAAILLLTLNCGGCRSVDRHGSSAALGLARRPNFSFSREEPQTLHQRLASAVAETPVQDEQLNSAVESVRLAEQAHRNSDPRCVALYADAVLASWQSLEASGGHGNAETARAELAWEIYHGTLALLTSSAIEFGRLDPQSGISWVTDDGVQQRIEIAHHGFPWRAKDFNELQLVPPFEHTKLKRYWSEPGLGVPLLVKRDSTEPPSDYMEQSGLYSATAILLPTSNHAVRQVSAASNVDSNQSRVVGVLNLYDPIRVTQVSHNDQTWDLARDVSAPLVVAQKQFNRDNFLGFLVPGKEEHLQCLRMIEPYQPGKIPVVFVHGLLSDRITWIDLVNDLRSVPWFNEHYQIWAYQYPTGQPFVRTAADMRKRLSDAIRYCDPQGTDPALRQMVLVGHSMGGLVSKLQICQCETELWDAVATRPLDKIVATEHEHDEINKVFCFGPLPFVQRVVFIGSPHQGSPFASGWAGWLGSKLVVRPKERTAMLKSLLHENPGLFDGKHRIPASVELLRPDNAILQATYNLHVNPAVQLHTIIGNGKPLKDGTPADGVVPVASARHPGTITEKLIDTTHTQLTDHPETTEEVLRILRQHAQQDVYLSSRAEEAGQLLSVP